MSTRKATQPRADIAIAIGLMLLFLTALWASLDWSFRTALFPRLVTASGVGFTFAYVAARLLRPGSRRQAPGIGTGRDESSVEKTADAHDAASNADNRTPEYAYATVGRTAWSRALGWVALFLVLLPTTGLFVASAVFAFCYLRWCACRSWVFAATYAAVLGGSFYLFLEVLLSVATPEALLW
jgi:hypothetical protein